MPGNAPLSLPPGARAVLCAPDAVARTLAVTVADPERRWLLRSARPVRRSFVAEVLEAGAGPDAQRRWMLEQDDDVRESYVAHVLEQAPEPDREAIWLLLQGADVRASFVAEVLDGGH
jgi:hypothetical protein